MPKFSDQSLDKLATCNGDLMTLFKEVIKYTDCTILCGFRNHEDQEQAFKEGRSKVHFPNSMHNRYPSRAVDVAPYPIDWNDRERFYMFVGRVRGIADMLGIKIRCGADWDGDMNWKDQNFHDLPHFELVRE